MRKILIIFLILFAVGCAKKYVTAPEEAVKPAETVEEAVTKPEAEEEVVEDVSIPSKEGLSEEKLQEGPLSLTDEETRIFRDVLFDFDKYNIRDDARLILNSLASYLEKNKEIDIVIEGHCDDRGTNEYNLALGERRARSVKNYLSSLGVTSARMSFITYGEEKPLCTEQNESCWQKNRRGHFAVERRR